MMIHLNSYLESVWPWPMVALLSFGAIVFYFVWRWDREQWRILDKEIEELRGAKSIGELVNIAQRHRSYK